MGRDGIKPDPKKVEAVSTWPKPNNVTEVQQFLGLTDFFRKFILGYAELVSPLTELTKKTKTWSWYSECEQAFLKLKEALPAAPVLAVPDVAAPCKLITDSCGYGIGAVLLQNSRPVAFYSRKMIAPEMHYVNYEQELLAAIVALKVFRCYLLGNHFNLITDNKPNTYLDTQPTLSRRQAATDQTERAAKRVCRRTAIAADTDSPDNSDIVSRIATVYSADPIFADDKRTKQWTFTENLWWDNDLVVVPDNSEVKQLIFHEFHESAYAGHLGIRKLSRTYCTTLHGLMFGLKPKTYIKYCDSCQGNKGNNTKPKGRMQPNAVPPYPRHTVTTDHVTGLPKTANKYDAIAVFIDELTKYVSLVTCSKQSSGANWAHVFVDNVYVYFGLPEHILCGTQFTGLFNQSLAERLGYSWKLTTAHPPWSAGQTETTNRIFEDVLRHCIAADMRDWDKHLKSAQFAMNKSWQESVQETPMFLNRGRHQVTSDGTTAFYTCNQPCI